MQCPFGCSSEAPQCSLNSLLSLLNRVGGFQEEGSNEHEGCGNGGFEKVARSDGKMLALRQQCQIVVALASFHTASASCMASSWLIL